MMRRLSSILLMMALPLTASAAPDDYEWLEELSADIAILHGCDIAYLSQVVERKVDSEVMVMAKVHCMDQRTFDALRLRTADMFEYKECTLRDKQSC